uniref:Rhamnogalacturonase A/B/Epimerase-like pectate lyase domain-containing protein n=1 Tax=Nelumbo nucifera TaxID=4432 RepID=A0A822ZMK7_NELNU|nr:TPA_asm: hypothetical protein HUJ06_017191 [Nelumbo nucifera]
MELRRSQRTNHIIDAVSVLLVLGLLATRGAECRKDRILDSFEYTAVSCRAHSASLTDFGAVGDGVTLNTKAFQAAIDHLSQFASDGGAQLFVPRGRWLTGSFNLTSHFTLYLHKDAVLLASQVWILKIQPTTGLRADTSLEV